MDKADLDEVNQLYSEYKLIGDALANFAADGKIIQMTVSGGPVGPGFSPVRLPVSLPTVHMTYPAAMVDAIKAALNTRVGEINAELAKFGVTGTG